MLDITQYKLVAPNLHMDTDELSREAYSGIFLEAEKLSHDLTLHFGLLSDDCKDETEYIDKAEELARQIFKLLV